MVIIEVRNLSLIQKTDEWESVRRNSPGGNVKLTDLLQYEKIYIQCHDNPDADALASGFALYRYFYDQGKNVVFFYSGMFMVQKANLKLMMRELQIPVIYKKTTRKIKDDHLLIMVDCQYGAGNVTKVSAKNIAVIDHHEPEMETDENCEIIPELGSCSTLVWKLMKDAGYPAEEDPVIGTALYCGLYSDTNQFADLSHPLDLEMRDSVMVDEDITLQFKNANISLAELLTAAEALTRSVYNEQYRFAIVKSAPCDPNILGIISDFLLQVESVDICVVYSILPVGIKLSVRSCIKEVHANELADFLCADMGSGGGHMVRAGGFIDAKIYDDRYDVVVPGTYIWKRMNEYFKEDGIRSAMKKHLKDVKMREAN